MTWDMCFARALGSPLLSGRVRQQPEDFRVEERLGFEPAGAGEHVYLHLRKTGANTGWVAGEIARLAGVRTRDVGYSGRKDRHAVTTQWFSCRLPGRLEPDWRPLRDRGIEVLSSRRHSRKLRLGSHAANRFRLVVRQLRAKGNMDEALAELGERMDELGAKGFPNYFGEQRFGRSNANLDRADELLGGKEFSLRKRGLYISAARSYLFNRQLSRRVEGGSWHGEDEAGWLWGSSRTALQAPDDPAFAHWYAGLESLGVKAMRRRFSVVPVALSHRLEGDALVLTFELPAGSFATSLLRELVDYTGVDRMDETTIKTGDSCGQTA